MSGATTLVCLAGCIMRVSIDKCSHLPATTAYFKPSLPSWKGWFILQPAMHLTEACKLDFKVRCRDTIRCLTTRNIVSRISTYVNDDSL